MESHLHKLVKTLLLPKRMVPSSPPYYPQIPAIFLLLVLVIMYLGWSPRFLGIRVTWLTLAEGLQSVRMGMTLRAFESLFKAAFHFFLFFSIKNGHLQRFWKRTRHNATKVKLGCNRSMYFLMTYDDPLMEFLQPPPVVHCVWALSVLHTERIHHSWRVWAWEYKEGELWRLPVLCNLSVKHAE